MEKNKDLIPEQFDSIDEAAEFWETHSLADYWNETQEVEADVRIPRRTRVTVATKLARQVAQIARNEGVSVETLVNLWIAERLQEAGDEPAEKQIAETEHIYQADEISGEETT